MAEQVAEQVAEPVAESTASSLFQDKVPDYSCPIVRIVKCFCNINEYCVETKEYREQNETLTT